MPLPELGTSPGATFPLPTPRNWHILGTNCNIRMTSSGGPPGPSPSWGQAPALHFSLTGSGRGVGAARVAPGQVIIRAWYKMRMEVPACRGRR